MLDVLKSLPAWSYAVILAILLLAAGAGEYFHMLPTGTFRDIFFVIAGLIAPSPLFPHQVAQITTPQATINTNKTEVQEPPR